jgi:GntR family transcriptional repressor for pyruvate dehydrogenase complex
MKPHPQSSGRAEDIMRSLETALLDGTYPAGSRLPSERQLAEEFGVSRNTVREAIQRLEARSLLRVKAGAGVYATSHLRGGQSSPWNQLLSDHPALRQDILEFEGFWKAQQLTLPRNAPPMPINKNCVNCWQSWSLRANAVI